MAKQKNAAKRTGCLIWLIPLSLGLIVLLANPKALRELQLLLGGRRVDSQSSQASVPEVRTLPDPSEIESIIDRDLQTQEIQQESLPVKQTFELFFVRYDPTRDQIKLIPSKRVFHESSTPALMTLTALLEGPSQGELATGLRTLIPKGTRINSLKIDAEILLLDLSKDFIANQTLGQEGLTLTIYQIVNTMTAFETIKGVRFLINGQVLSFAGGDGIPLDKIFRHNSDPLKGS